MSDFKIKGCENCPLYDDGVRYEFSHHCNHPNSIQEVNTFTSEPEIQLTSEVKKSKINELEYDYTEITPVTPDWCPLKKEPLTISYE